MRITESTVLVTGANRGIAGIAHYDDPSDRSMLEHQYAALVRADRAA
jgi:hypothetical protein